MKKHEYIWPSAHIPPVDEIVTTVFRNHPKHCIFAPGACERVIARTPANLTHDELLDYLEFAIRAEEIYCPHEGIDRREEHGG